MGLKQKKRGKWRSRERSLKEKGKGKLSHWRFKEEKLVRSRREKKTKEIQRKKRDEEKVTVKSQQTRRRKDMGDTNKRGKEGTEQKQKSKERGFDCTRE